MSQQYGYGSVYQRASDKRWVASVQVESERGGLRRRRVFYGKTEREALLKLEAWRAENPQREHRGRAANLAAARAIATHTPREWWALVRSSGCRCAYCGRDAFGSLEQDHIVPLSRGGSDGIDNIAVACHDCNVEKGTMTADEYAVWKVAAS